MDENVHLRFLLLKLEKIVELENQYLYNYHNILNQYKLEVAQGSIAIKLKITTALLHINNFINNYDN